MCDGDASDGPASEKLANEEAVADVSENANEGREESLAVLASPSSVFVL